MDNSNSSEDVATVDVFTAKDLLQSGFRYLDVRTTDEFNKSHIENAVNVPYMFITPQGRVKNPEFLEQVSLVCTKDDQLILGCNSGGRASRACVDLINVGYVNVKKMEGGYSRWVDSSLARNNKLAEELKTACKFRP